MQKIFLSCGTVTLVSDEDYIFLLGFSWCLTGGGYAHGWIGGKHQRMHRVIAARAGLDCLNEIDHITGDPLDNRRENLRAATRGQNIANSKRSKSGLKGTTLRPNGRWQSQICVNKRGINLGTFDTEEEAHDAYCGAAKHYFGKFANSGAVQ